MSKDDSSTTRNQVSRSPEFKLRAVYRDRDLLVIDKPYDVAMGKDFTFSVQTLIARDYPEMLESPSDGCKRERKVHFVHMLDYETSGVLCIGFTKKVTSSLCRAITAGRSVKFYVAIVQGRMNPDNVRNLPGVTFYQGWEPDWPAGSKSFERFKVRTFIILDQDPDLALSPLSQVLTTNNPAHREAMSSIVILGYGTHQGKQVTHLLLRLHTGRRHQLRLHCLHLGHPIVGDQLYCPEVPAKRTMLHAYSMKILNADTTQTEPVYNFVAADVLRPEINSYEQIRTINEVLT